MWKAGIAFKSVQEHFNTTKLKEKKIDVIGDQLGAIANVSYIPII